MQRRPRGRRVREKNFPFPALSKPVKPRRGVKREPELTYPCFAVIVIFAFSTFDTGQPFSAASAYF
jgi:hypothetical protein